MFQDNEIIIKNLKGVAKIIAEKCDHNGDNLLKKTKDYDEISVFSNALSTLDDNNTFIFGGKAYNADGSINMFRNIPVDTKNPTISKEDSPIVLPNLKPVRKDIQAEPADATRVAKQIPIPQPKPASPAAIGMNSSTRNNSEWSVIALNRAINDMTYKKMKKYRNSLLIGKGEAFIKSAKKYNIDPRLLVAIAMHESARGTDTLGKNSIGGTHKNFATVDDSIDLIAATINKFYKSGLKTANAVAPSYSSPKAAQNWRTGVNAFLIEIDKGYRNHLKKM